ncbi:MAG: RNA polymerase sigma-70 factor [Balneolaceae bacterium]
MLNLLSFHLLVTLLIVKENDGNDSQNHALFTSIQSGDQEAFRIFFEQHYNSLHHYLQRFKLDSSAADDIIQKAYIYIWEHRENIRPELSLKAYLYRIAYTRMINHLKSSGRYKDLESNAESSTEITPEDHLIHTDLTESLNRAVEQLPERRRAVFKSCFLHELSYKETASILNITVKTVENHMALALKDIRAALEPFK